MLNQKQIQNIINADTRRWIHCPQKDAECEQYSGIHLGQIVCVETEEEIFKNKR